MTEFEDYEDKDEDAEDLMENDKVSPEEEGFLKGYDAEESDEDPDAEEEPEQEH